MEETWESLFTREANNLKHSDRYIQECLLYAQHLHQRNLPVIFDKTHLAAYLNMHLSGLENALLNYSKFYQEYDISKKAGGKRHLSVPTGVIKKIQDWTYKSILLPSYTPPACVHGFVRKADGVRRTIVTNAAPHVGKPYLMNLDISNFFDSITESRVKDVFVGYGYEEEVATALTAVCTYKGRLPQGASTSPILSNMVSVQVDSELQSLAENHGCIYTRYADDLTFSSENPITIEQEVSQILKKHGFHLNKKKTKYRGGNVRQEVTGLTVNDGVHVPKQYRHDIWQELYYCKKFGIENHIRHLNLRNGRRQGFYRQWLLGRIMYIRSVDADCGNRMLEEFNKLDWIL